MIVDDDGTHGARKMVSFAQRTLFMTERITLAET
jgi:hypothetical protein